MAWKAKLISIPETNDAVDSFYAEIEYYDSATSRSFRQSFKFTAGTGLSLQQARDAVSQKVAALTALDNTKSVLIPYIGQDVA